MQGVVEPGKWLALRCLALVVPVLLICLSTQAQNREALLWTGVGLLIFQVVSTACSWYVWRFGYLMEEEEALVQP